MEEYQFHPSLQLLRISNKSVLTNSNVPLDSLSIPLILVVKKNKAVLNSIYKLFNGEKKDQTYNKINQSLLFIDDEADNLQLIRIVKMMILHLLIKVLDVF